MEENKTDESVKAGLQLEADSNPLKRKRKRIPVKRNLARELNSTENLPGKGFEGMAGHDEEDMDELVHSRPGTKTGRDDEERDPDDQVHGK